MTLETDKEIQSGLISLVCSWRGDFKPLYASTATIAAGYYDIDYNA